MKDNYDPEAWKAWKPGEAQPMKLTARQRSFMSLAARPDGFCPYDPPKGAPMLRNEELDPMTAANLVVFSEADDTWNTTEKGDELLKVAP